MPAMFRFGFFSFTILLAACFFDRENSAKPKPGPGTEPDPETASTTGRIFRANGDPAAHARVRLFPVAYLPHSAASPKYASGADSVYATVADALGRYSLDTSLDGEYNILADLDGEVAYADSVSLSAGRTATLLPDTLAKPGSLSGTVVLQPNHDPQSAVVQVLGTYIYSNVDKDGRFRLGDLAGGTYSLRVTVNEGAYTSLYLSLRTHPGEDDTLASPMRPPFTGIPVVTGVKAAYDTLHGVVSLSWDPVDYRSLAEYLVYRDTALAVVLSASAIGGAADTAFRDSLYRPGAHGLFDLGDSLDRAFDYRIRVRNLSDSVGPVYGVKRVAVISPTKVRTRIAFGQPKIQWDPSARKDSISLAVAIANPNRGLSRIEWRVDNDTLASRTREPGKAKSIADTLRFAWGAEGTFRVRVLVEDEAGTLWQDSLRIAGNRAPTISGTPVTEAKANVPFRFAPAASDPDGDSLIFSVANLPGWASFDSLTGAITGLPSNADTGLYPGILLSVRDGRRSDSLTAFSLRIAFNAWAVRKPALAQVQAGFAVPFGDGIWVFRDWFIPGRAIDRYVPATDTWTHAATLPEDWLVLGAHRVGDRILAIVSPRVNPPSGFTVRAYDPAADSWTNLGPINLQRSNFRSAEMNGKIYFFGGGSDLVEEYDPITNGLTVKKPSPRTASSSVAVAVVGDRIFLVGYADPSAGNKDSVMAYEPATDIWSLLPPLPSKRQSVSACGMGGKLYAAGGFDPSDNRYPMRGLEEYDPSNRTWTTREDMPTARIAGVCAESGGKLYVIGGGSGFGGSSDIEKATEEYTPR